MIRVFLVIPQAFVAVDQDHDVHPADQSMPAIPQVLPGPAPDPVAAHSPTDCPAHGNTVTIVFQPVMLPVHNHAAAAPAVSGGKDPAEQVAAAQGAQAH